MALEKRYADAFLEHARESIGFEKGLEELKSIKDILRDNPDFKVFLEGPAIMRSEKYQVIDAALGAGYSNEIRNFIKLLVKKDRIEKFIEIEEYARVKYAHGEKVDAVLKTGYPLDTELISLAKEALENRLKKKVHLYVDLDTDLGGGIRIEFGNKVLDGSVSKRLVDLRQKLMAVRIN